MPKAFLIDYRNCFNCHSCEVACQMHNGFAPGQGGVVVNPVGPWEFNEDCWEYDFVPFFTEQCMLCEERTTAGKLPSCVQHCEGRCLKFGEAEDLMREMGGKPKQILQVMTS